MFAREWILAGRQRVENGIGGGELVVKIYARWIEVAGVGTLIERQCVFGGSRAVLLREGRNTGPQPPDGLSQGFGCGAEGS
jgi:hypothetical protein